MSGEQKQRHRRTGDPYLDRRTGEDRRLIHRIGYFAEGGIESRTAAERRTPHERRQDCIRVTRWSSVCAEQKTRTPEDRKKVRPTPSI